MIDKALAALPKIELHIHFEGTVGPALLERIRPDLVGAGGEDLRSLYGFTGF